MKSLLAAFGFLVTAHAFAEPLHPAGKERQTAVAQRGAQVMPFTLAATSHIFTKTRDGGIQRVIARDKSDITQIKLARAHLREIQQQFLNRNFDGPSHIHGGDMPGLAELKEAKPGQLAIAYRKAKGGAELVYRASEPKLVHALHLWFDAQLSDHGADAMEGHHHAM